MTFLDRLGAAIDAASERIGRATAWCALIMVLVQFVVVVMRYIFGIGSIMMQESVVYLHSFMFLIGAGYTLLHDGHVRVDIFYRTATPRNKAIVDILGVVFFLIPVSLLIWIYTWPYARKSWQVLEGSKETSGIHAVFILKSMILAFAALMILQGIALAARSFVRLAKPKDDAKSLPSSGHGV